MKIIYLIAGIILSLACTLGTAITPTLDPVTSTNIISPTSVSQAYISSATIIYYDISGSSEIELRQQLDLLSPTGFDNFKGDSTTNWNIYWNWGGYGTSTCDLNSAEVTYTVEVIMPRWTAPNNAPTELITKWNQYIKVLSEHEQGHVDFVVENYTIVEDAIKNATCDTAESVAQEALAVIRQHDIDYDAETDHGATQGARFP